MVSQPVPERPAWPETMDAALPPAFAFPPKPRPVRVVALTPRAASLAGTLAARLAGATCWLPEHLAEGLSCRTFRRFSQVAAEAFSRGEDLVCIMAAGIVVRTLAPLLRGKAVDPAVVVVDEAGRFAISLLSGHLGGANELARTVAGIIGALPVITTATDVAGLPALDALAPELGLHLENLAAARGVSMALLKGEAVTLVDQEGRLAGLARAHPGCFSLWGDLDAALAQAGPGVYVGCEERAWPASWLRLRPRVLVAGLGCHRGTPARAILAFITQVFQAAGLSLGCLRALATVAARRNEPGLKEAARHLGVELLWFTPAELKEVAVPNPSPHPVRHVGTPSVAEAAAVKAAAGRLLLPKQKGANLTLAVARAG